METRTLETIKECVDQLQDKPLSAWDPSDFTFISQHMAYNYGSSGKVTNWIHVFSKIASYMPLESLPLTLWLFTYDFSSIPQAWLCVLDTAIAYPNRPKQARKERNRVLCRLRKTLFSHDARLGAEFNRRLRWTSFALHYCNDCASRPKIVFVTSRRTYQWL